MNDMLDDRDKPKTPRSNCTEKISLILSEIGNKKECGSRRTKRSARKVVILRVPRLIITGVFVSLLA